MAALWNTRVVLRWPLLPIKTLIPIESLWNLMYQYIYIHYIHCIPLHYLSLHGQYTLHCIPLHYIPFIIPTLHYVTSLYLSLPYLTLRYVIHTHRHIYLDICTVCVYTYIYIYITIHITTYTDISEEFTLSSCLKLWIGPRLWSGSPFPLWLGPISQGRSPVDVLLRLRFVFRTGPGHVSMHRGTDLGELQNKQQPKAWKG